MKLDILAIGAHPDDIELSCSGTLLLHIAQGKSVGLIDLSKGEMGTRGTPEIRLQEGERARQLMKAQTRDNLGFKDGALANDYSHQQELIRYLRFYRPEIVLCNAPQDRHPDHGLAANLVADACFYSGLTKRLSHWNQTQQTAWRPRAVYHYIQDEFLKPDFVIDISSVIEEKRALIGCFASQFYNPQSKEPETPISTKNFFQSVESKMAVFGRAIAADYAEGCICHRYPGVKSLFDLS